MLAQERLNDIVRKVNEEGSVKVRELAALYQVTEDCIRKDLTSLEKQGLLKRTHGGAFPVRVHLQDLDVEVRKDKHIPEKIRIARTALQLIQNGDLIFLDISTISIELARQLAASGRTVTVVTNMIDVMLQLIRVSSIKTIFIGGTFSCGYEGFVGCLANEQLVPYHFDLAFLGTVGVNVMDSSVLTYMPEDGETKKLVIQHSRSAWLMMEATKFYNDGTYQYASLHQIHGIITDSRPAETLCRQLEKDNVRLLCPEE